MRKAITIICFFLLGSAVVLMLALSCKRQPESIRIERIAPDTVVVEKVKLVHVDRPVYPGRVWLQEKIDSALVLELAKRERELIGIEKKNENKLFKKDKTYLNIQTIEKATNKISQQEFEIFPDESFVIDANGRLQINEKDRKKAKRKNFWRKVGNTAKDVGIFGAGAIVGGVVIQ